MSVKVGDKVKGKVTAITNFGAFMQLPNGRTGLVHISEVSTSYIKDLKDHLKVEDELEVKVLSETDGKIALSIKQVQLENREKSGVSSYHNSKSSYKKRTPPKDFVKKSETFEDKITKFMKSSEENLSMLKKKTETKRGGRGGRRA